MLMEELFLGAAKATRKRLAPVDSGRSDYIISLIFRYASKWFTV